MGEDNDVPGSATAGWVSAEPRLDAERLDVYRIALEFHALAAGLGLGRQMLTRLCQHLDARAAAM